MAARYTPGPSLVGGQTTAAARQPQRARSNAAAGAFTSLDTVAVSGTDECDDDVEETIRLVDGERVGGHLSGRQGAAGSATSAGDPSPAPAPTVRSAFGHTAAPQRGMEAPTTVRPSSNGEGYSRDVSAAAPVTEDLSSAEHSPRDTPPQQAQAQAQAQSAEERLDAYVAKRLQGEGRGLSGISQRRDKWEARLHLGKRVLYLGRFSTRRDAEIAYSSAAFKFRDTLLSGTSSGRPQSASRRRRRSSGGRGGPGRRSLGSNVQLVRQRQSARVCLDMCTHCGRALTSTRVAAAAANTLVPVLDPEPWRDSRAAVSSPDSGTRQRRLSAGARVSHTARACCVCASPGPLAVVPRSFVPVHTPARSFRRFVVARFKTWGLKRRLPMFHLMDEVRVWHHVLCVAGAHVVWFGCAACVGMFATLVGLCVLSARFAASLKRVHGVAHDVRGASGNGVRVTGCACGGLGRSQLFAHFRHGVALVTSTTFPFGWVVATFQCEQQRLSFQHLRG